MRDRLYKIAALFSQLLNVLIFNGSPDETISGRAWRQGKTSYRWVKTRIWIDRVFFWDEDHCYKSHQRDIEFAKMILKVTV